MSCPLHVEHLCGCREQPWRGEEHRLLNRQPPSRQTLLDRSGESCVLLSSFHPGWQVDDHYFSTEEGGRCWRSVKETVQLPGWFCAERIVGVGRGSMAGYGYLDVSKLSWDGHP